MASKDLAQEVIEILRETHQKLVLAESCTGGLIAAALTQIPGASEVFCGSSVIYRVTTKSEWLGISTEELQRHGDVGKEITEILVKAVLNKTPEATMALAVTGHLGPKAPAEIDGFSWSSIQWKQSPKVMTEKHSLGKSLPLVSELTLRAHRQREAAQLALMQLVQALKEHFKK